MLKLNGQRVEPGEIEAALRRSPEIAEVEVSPHERAGTTRIVAFVVPRADAAPDLVKSWARICGAFFRDS
jgi:acyl-coenzyme A synthetase/AMP-(fatty) acid ligase